MGLDHERLRKARERAKLTQAQAAQRSGLGTAQRWNDIESGRRANVTVDTLMAIAAALGVKPDSLLPSKRKPPPR